ncbi:MAG: metallophosphoesterase family protein [Candidatus Lokiarchaeota archaeon]|nr:metallophosphoesterase family protein [Candidatus Lokiarchaeota archaeon]
MVFHEDLADWAQDRNYQALVYTLVPAIAGGFGLLAAYLLYLSFRKLRPVRRRDENSKLFRVCSAAGVAAAATLAFLLVTNFLDDLADVGSDEYWIYGSVVIAAFSLVGAYHGFCIFRKKKTRRAVIYSAFSIFLMVGASVTVGLYQMLSYASENRGPYLSWSDDPTTTMTVAWESPQPAPKTLQWADAASFSSYNQIVATERDDRATTGRYHYNATITGLLPNTPYYYRVPGFHDQVTPFKTAPSSTVPFTFFAYGDSREASLINSEHVGLLSQMSALASQGSMPAFILNTGDLATDWDDVQSWDIHFQTIKPLAQSVPYVVATGNHEWNEAVPDRDNAHTLIHEFPSTGPGQINETSFAFQFSNAYIICLGYPHDGTSSRSARAWLEGQLAYANASSSIDWVFLAWHRPPFTGTTSRDDNNGVKNNTADLLHKYDADLVFLGHDHNYQRINITHSSNYTNDVTYIITGGGGAPLYDVASASWDGTDATGQYGEKYFGATVVAKSTYEFLEVAVDGLTATFTSYELGGAIIDQFSITK